MLRHRTWNFNIDRYIDPLVPPPPWPYLPYPVARLFGYRKTKPVDTGNLMPITWAFIGIFCAILILEAVVKRVPSFESHGVPIIVGSFGAAAVLEFYSIESPLAQPRNAIFGQLISAIAGISVAKLFLLSDRFDDVQWVAGALACASATALMALTKTVHPPAGATALLAVVDRDLLNIGWLLIPLVLLSCALMLGVALVLNNIERQFPMYWWTPEDLKQARPVFLRRTSSQAMEEAAIDSEETANDERENGNHSTDENSMMQDDYVTDVEENQPSTRALAYARVNEMTIKHGQVIVPEHMFITQEEELLLESMSYRI
ncbi:HPP family protein [Ilyonectria destructans]|nr:HPP family protein [Ilyonectria destructans]